MRPIDADKLKAKIRPAEADDTRCSVLISDVKKIFHTQIDEAPTLTYEDLVPHAKWKYFRVDPFDCTVTDIVQCSYCDRPYYRFRGVRHNFCPNCGAKMDLEGENDA